MKLFDILDCFIPLLKDIKTKYIIRMLLLTKGLGLRLTNLYDIRMKVLC